MRRRFRWRPRRAESGQSIVTVALMSFFLLAILAVVVESSAVYFQRRNLQNTADAAALAGAQSLTGLQASESVAIAAAQDYIAKNIDGATYPTPDVTDNYTQIRVVVKKKSATAFAGWLSFGQPEVAASATARIAAPLLPGPGVVPLAIDLPTYDACIDGGECTGITLKEFSGNNDVPKRNYGFLDLGGQGGGNNEICNYIKGGATVPIMDPDRAEPGDKNGMRDCLAARLEAAESNNCLTIGQVLDGDGSLLWRCNPLGGAARGANGFADIQPTAVIIIPVVQDFDEGGCNAFNNCVNIIGEGDELRTFAFFLIDRTTVNTVNGVGPTCTNGNNGNGGKGKGGNGQPNGQCWITGQFLQTWAAPVSTQFELPTGEYDPNASLLKIVQLIE
ncbi:MAG: pilus assembly protein TadG-related protein [Dehalococcoidia bacterium]